MRARGHAIRDDLRGQQGAGARRHSGTSGSPAASGNDAATQGPEQRGRGTRASRSGRRAKSGTAKRTSSIARSIALESWADRLAVFLLIDLALAAALVGTFIHQCIRQIPEPLRSEINFLEGAIPRTVSWRAGEPGPWDDAVVFTPIAGDASAATEYVFPLSELWEHAIPVGAVILPIEALSLLGGLTEARRIRRRLRPLNELALVAEAFGSATADGAPPSTASATPAPSVGAARSTAGPGETRPTTEAGDTRRRPHHGWRNHRAGNQGQAAYASAPAMAGAPDVPATFARLEHAIDAVSVDAPSVTTDDKDLQSIEVALNGLLRRMHEATTQQARFVSDASHELRTPIAVIRGYVDMLDRWGKGDEEVLDESIAALKAETTHMQELVEQLLFLARGDAGRQALESAPFDLMALVEEVAEESQMIDADHRYVVRPPNPVDGAESPAGASPWTIVGDRAMIKQALRVLVSNAARYSPTGSPIELGVRPDAAAGQLGCFVEDRGMGMASEDVGHVFERFYRADAARDQRKEGTGLGLSIAKWIVDAHGGRIDILTSENIGTRFTIWLPATP